MAKTITIGFTGTRAGLTAKQRKALIYAFNSYGKGATFIHGDCIGADAQAHTAALEAGLTVDLYPCNISSQRAFCGPYRRFHEPKSPLERNHDIVDASDIMIACPSGMKEKLRSGTWATIRYARKVGKPLIILWPKG